MNKFTGIDVSKASLDVCFLQIDEKTSVNVRYPNTEVGFKKLLAMVDKDHHVVMEATGVYSVKIATYLYEAGIPVSVVNPLVIKRFTQMLLSRTKTDKKDAYQIALYGAKQSPGLWHPSSLLIMEMKQVLTCLEGREKQRTMLINQMEALSCLPWKNKVVENSDKQLLKTLEAQIKCLESRLEEITGEQFPATYASLQTIPGIGKKTAIMLIAITNNFENFDNARQLLSYIGLAPRIYESGTSVKGKGHICKMGMGRVRKILYMCSWSAKKCNAECKALYHRLKEKGKPEKVIKIAIANKLLRTAFAVGKYSTPYKQNLTEKACF